MKRWMVMSAGVIVAVLAATMVVRAGNAGANPDVALPDYRDWTHVKSMVIFDPSHPLHADFGGIHHVYANDVALPSTKTEKFPYPDGSALVFVLYDIKNANGAYVATDKKVTAVMIKDSKKYAATGGWAFQAWDPTGKALITDGGASCFACHRDQAAKTDYVFSRFEP
ncbi:MAG: cytochrome P460 family protein [Verrucomicrobiae bacterium]|nr:cytochrome P460 family protein [Verrucomicrobiae bacterium]